MNKNMNKNINNIEYNFLYFLKNYPNETWYLEIQYKIEQPIKNNIIDNNIIIAILCLLLIILFYLNIKNYVDIQHIRCKYKIIKNRISKIIKN